MKSSAKIAIVGAGLGGTSLAALLQKAGLDVTLYEQAPAFERLGAGIHLTPNLMRVLCHIGVGEHLAATGYHPGAFLSRAWDTGDVLFRLELGAEGEARYGAPYITVHRGDLHLALASAVDEDRIVFKKRVVSVENHADVCRLHFADGESAEAGIVIGADGVNSVLRQSVLGPERAKYTGHVAHRAVVPAAVLGAPAITGCTKWWGPDRHLLIYYMTRQQDEIYLVTSFPEPVLSVAGSWAPCDLDEFRTAAQGFHPEVQRVVQAAGSVTKWPVFDQDPVSVWSQDSIVLLGDACHPMRPYMAQGAAMAIEDAAMLARCISAVRAGGDLRAAFPLYERNRIERTRAVQEVSAANNFLRLPSDPSWVFSYDPFAVALEPAER